MSLSASDTIAQLRETILLLQGFKPVHQVSDAVLPAEISESFPNKQFPQGAIHEFMCAGLQESSASCAFMAAIAAGLMKRSGVGVWITAHAMIFPPALTALGIQPDKMLFIQLQNPKDILRATEEVLKCEAVSVVISEIKELSFTQSRRFQLATEQSKVTGLLLRSNAKSSAVASVSRWRITPARSESDLMPGVGFLRWNVKLEKIRNGKVGEWVVERRTDDWVTCGVDDGIKRIKNKVHELNTIRMIG
jgi:protein ImuA